MTKKKFRWKLVDRKGNIISRHYTKQSAQRAQILSSKPYVYVRRINLDAKW